MKRLQYSRYGLSVCAAALLAGCGGPQGQFSPSGAMPPNGAPAVRSEQNQSTISTAATNNLIYVALGGNVSLFTSQGAFQGRIVVRSAGVNGAKTTAGECADQAGDIFVTESFGRDQSQGDIRGFAPGSTSPIARFADQTGAPSACSVDPTTGNLAVTNSAGPGVASNSRTLLVYSHAAKPPMLFTDVRMAHFSSVGYDSSGNLFVDGVDANNAFAFAELAKGSSSFKTITLNHSITSPGSVQFDGQFMTVADRSSGIIYRFTIDGTAGTEVGSTSLGKKLVQTWIAGDEVVAAWSQTAGNQQAACLPGACASGVSIWHYPAGGLAFQELGNEPENATGVTISVAPAH